MLAKAAGLLEQQEDMDRPSVVGIVMQGPEPKPVINIERMMARVKFDVNKTPHERILENKYIKKKKPKFSSMNKHKKRSGKNRGGR